MFKTLLYMLMRAWVYAMYPLDVVGWFIRDAIMDIPRLVGFGLALGAGLVLWGRRGLGLHLDRWRAGLALSAVFTVVWMGEFVFREHDFDLSLHMLLVLTGSSFIVALFEEVLFRGLLFTPLRDKWGLAAAVWGTALLFTVYHVQAQPLVSWPNIFFAGVFLGAMRAHGIGLGWLILAHGVYDSALFFGSYGDPLFAWMSWLVLAVEFGASLGLFLCVKSSNAD